MRNGRRFFVWRELHMQETALSRLNQSQVDFLMLLLAAIAVALSFFFLHQARRFQRWITLADEDAPDPAAGVVLAAILSPTMVILWVVYLAITDTKFRNLWNYTLEYAATLIPGVLLASLIPAGVAVFKLGIAASVANSEIEDPTGARKKPRRATLRLAIFFAVFNLLFNSGAFLSSIIKLLI
jgi:hypothetical protein